MKLAILSMQRVENYGSVLQAYSLKTIVEKIIGERVYFIDIDRKNIVDANMPVVDRADYINGVSYKSSYRYMINKVVNKVKMKKWRRQVQKFQVDVLGCNEQSNAEHYDMVIVGSDEVFKCAKRVYLQLYGDVKNADQVITYAASCGSAVISGIPENNRAIVKEAMNKFSSLSVRDKGTYDYVSNLYDGEIVYNLDPVLMGDLNLLEHKKTLNKKYMVVYGYGDRIRTSDEINAIKKYAKDNGLITVAVGAPQFWCDKFVAVDPMRALDYFYHAECVVTDTFHGAIFSIINHCKFGVFLRATNKNKLGDLLERLLLKDQIINDTSKLAEILDRDIDYKATDEVINIEKKNTLDYLRKNIIVNK